MLGNSLHPNTTVMLEAWKRITTTPQDINGGPSADEYPGLLNHLFIIEANRAGYAPFRTVGDSLTDMLGRNLIGTNFLDLWIGPDKDLVEALLKCVNQEDRPGVLRGFGETNTGRRLEIEIAIAPLGHATQSSHRLLCLYQALGGTAMLQKRSIWAHRVRSITPPEPNRHPAKIRLVSSNEHIQR